MKNHDKSWAHFSVSHFFSTSVCSVPTKETIYAVAQTQNGHMWFLPCTSPAVVDTHIKTMKDRMKQTAASEWNIPVNLHFLLEVCLELSSANGAAWHSIFTCNMVYMVDIAFYAYNENGRRRRLSSSRVKKMRRRRSMTTLFCHTHRTNTKRAICCIVFQCTLRLRLHILSADWCALSNDKTPIAIVSSSGNFPINTHAEETMQRKRNNN